MRSDPILSDPKWSDLSSTGSTSGATRVKEPSLAALDSSSSLR